MHAHTHTHTVGHNGLEISTEQSCNEREQSLYLWILTQVCVNMKEDRKDMAGN